MLIKTDGVGYAELRSSCGLDTVHSDVCEPYEGSSRQMRLALDHHEKTVQLCRSRSPWDSKHTCSLVSAVQLDMCVAKFLAALQHAIPYFITCRAVACCPMTVCGMSHDVLCHLMLSTPCSAVLSCYAILSHDLPCMLCCDTPCYVDCMFSLNY